jgi:hypothetical protein
VKGLEGNILNRNTIKRIKRMLVYQKQEYLTLRDKFFASKNEDDDEENDNEDDEDHHNDLQN